MARYLIGRILGMVVVFVLVSIVAFLLMHSVPGGPFDEEKSPLPPAARANILRKYGLDQPLYVQYLRYMGNALRGDFGISYQSPTESVLQLIGRAWPVSIKLGGMAIVVAFSSGLLFGILAAVKQNSMLDYVVTFISTLGLTVPSFVIAIWLLLLFAVRLRWLPTGGWPSGGSGDWKTMIMPVITLALGPSALVARYTRSSLVEVIHADYIRTARAKGLSETVVVMRHALKNALIPLITVFGPQIPNLITGTIFVEVIYRVPGLGKFFVSSIYLRDYPMIMATMLLVATLWSFTYLLSDILYTLVDPRVRLYGDER
ncbi:MAG TPA: ABC transporter permease [Kouleothrix sp.]|uniref:ABC transporter permease n=1 Tax=Kouleothrix sp. TaxID=2779161 RepID=UPI002B6E9465|nr:ABC transporter permease [Kouleothrix sp.]HRC75699.1 ABC transporter permease [Kouleothrix sp.]